MLTHCHTHYQMSTHCHKHNKMFTHFHTHDQMPVQMILSLTQSNRHDRVLNHCHTRDNMLTRAATCCQLRVKVSDAGIPPCSKTIVATVNVRRNLHDPRFVRGEWPVTILETHALTESIVTVEAKDKDEKVT